MEQLPSRECPECHGLNGTHQGAYCDPVYIQEIGHSEPQLIRYKPTRDVFKCDDCGHEWTIDSKTI
jgi:hypothetical protein